MSRWVWVPLLWVACWSTQHTTGTEPERPAPAVEVVAAERPQASGLSFEERWIGGAVPGSDVPVIVAVHGMGADPVGFAGVMEGWPTPARLVLPRAPTPRGSGFTWMTVRSSGSQPEVFAQQLDAAAARVAALCAEVAQSGKRPVLIGFSQGGMIAWTVALRHPDTISGAVPLSGFIPAALVPATVKSTPPVRALHGVDDAVVPFDRDLASVTAAQEAGVDASIEAFPATGHAVPAPMRQALFREITKLQSL